jgi:hypothetical protein
MRLIRFAALSLFVFGLALPLAAQDDDDEKPAPKKDEKKDDDKKDEKTDKKLPEVTKEQLAGCEYFPLAVGTTWTFDLNGQKVTITVAEHEKKAGILCARLETTTAQGASGSEHMTVMEDGVYRVAYNGVKIDPPIRILKLPPKKGDEWKVKCKQGEISIKGKYSLDEEDDVDVPAGTFKTIKATGEVTAAGQEIESVCWYAKGKGMVKQEVKLAGQTLTFELKKFKKGTGKAAGDEDEKKDKDDKKDEKKAKDD